MCEKKCLEVKIKEWITESLVAFLVQIEEEHRFSDRVR